MNKSKIRIFCDSDYDGNSKECPWVWIIGTAYYKSCDRLEELLKGSTKYTTKWL